MLPIAILLLMIIPLTGLSSTFKELENKLQNTKSIRVVFIQKTQYSWYPKPELSKGVFYATKDGKFRIEYTYPDKVVMVSNGKEIIILNEEDKEAIIDNVENNTSPVIESLFFFSKPLGEVFEPVGELEKSGLRVLILKPKQRDENIKEVYVELDAELEVKKVRVVDSENTQTTLEFIEVRKNFQPSSGLFKIELPPDVKVRRAGSLK
ncbi:outer membrane lipoprotein carrier protein [Hydrogenivirga caldilitoris]|uniref:Outer membrane lipoprotein carrier protein n=1 Tax=Hydrogenivirga caldilitoris TaxID=246264 RepID=A0A497XSH2_9AQUI|nr:outer membrane lipoprotein carrier protein LolA [Hydrogenivirga caldilitoris]RLJ71049.1 outer membrane lipoprotein carrier protein [Hydrogenivirga caldilitoris]